jgi:hypothetical protein
MTNYLLVFGSDWRGRAVECQFTALADNKTVSARDDSAPVYQLPDSTSTVKITAKPKAVPGIPLRWDKTVTLSVGSSGPITAAADSVAYVTIKPPKPIGSEMQYTLVFIKLSRFKDATDDVVRLLDPSSLPKKRSFSDDGEMWVTRDVVAAKEVQEHKDMYGTWPPPAKWALEAVPHAHFLDVGNPVKSGVLNFKPPGALPGINVDSVVLRMAGTDVPQYFAVTWPNTITMTPTSAPTPFFLFIRQSNRGNQYDRIGLFVGGDLAPYPDNFDYADEGMFASLHYADDPLRTPWSKGVPYQAAMAGNKVVTVAPCNKFADEFGVLKKTEETRRILEEIQAFMFWRSGIPDPPTAVGKTAIAAFSSGTFHLHNWLIDTDNLSGKFLTEGVNAVYWLDPRTDFVDDFIKASLDWASYGATDKSIRLYMRYPSNSHRKLLGTTYSAPYVRSTSPDNKRTAAVISDADWARVRAKYLAPPVEPVDWTFSHFAICSTMLTHALAQDFH